MNKENQWQGRSHGGRFGHRVFLFLLRRFGLGSCYALLVFVAFYFAFLKRGIYKESAAYLRRILRVRRYLMPLYVYRHLYNFGKTLIDKWAYNYGIGGIKVDNAASEGIKSLIADGSGLLVVNAHFGAWDISSNILRQSYGRDTFVLGLSTEDEDISELLEQHRVQEKVEAIEPDKLSVLNAYNLLKGGAVIALQGDRMLDQGRGGEVTFLGTRVTMPLSPYALARHAQVPLVQVHCVRTASRRYKIMVFPPLNGGHNAEPVQLQMYAKNLENLVLKYPYQWANFYNFFGENRNS